MREAFDRRGELILAALLKGDAAVDHIAGLAGGDLTRLATAENILQDADDYA